MAAYTITATSVITQDTSTATGTAGESIAAGEFIYKDTDDSNRLKKAVATSEKTAKVVGIALNGAAAGQPVQYAGSGKEVTVGTVATLQKGKILVLSNTAGKAMPAGDLSGSTGYYVTILGYAKTATVVALQITPSAVTDAA